jgi:hypothetical protein
MHGYSENPIGNISYLSLCFATLTALVIYFLARPLPSASAAATSIVRPPRDASTNLVGMLSVSKRTWDALRICKARIYLVIIFSYFLLIADVLQSGEAVIFQYCRCASRLPFHRNQAQQATVLFSSY